MTKAELRRRQVQHNFTFVTYCPQCQEATLHYEMFTTFGESKEGPTIEKFGWCMTCQNKHEKITVVKPVVKDAHKKKAPRQEFCLVG